MTKPNQKRWYLRERYAVSLVFATLAVVAALLGILARGDAGNEPTPEPSPTSTAPSPTDASSGTTS